MLLVLGINKTYFAKRGLSWFSAKFPSNVGSTQSDATELIMLDRELILPLGEVKALTRG